MVFVSSEEVFLSFKYLKFCLDFLIMEKNDLIRTIMLISKFFGVTTCKKDCTNILRNKDNHLLFYYYLIFIFFFILLLFLSVVSLLLLLIVLNYSNLAFFCMLSSWLVFCCCGILLLTLDNLFFQLISFLSYTFVTKLSCPESVFAHILS